MTQKTEEIKFQIAEYSATAAALAELRGRLEGATYDVATTAGMETAKKDRRELVTLRTSLESKRKEIKAPALERCRLIDDEAKKITAELLKLEQPIDAQIKAEEERKAAIKAEKERIERERVAGIQERIGKIRNLPAGIVGMNSADLTLYIAKIEAAQIGGEFAEFAEEAATVKAEVVASLNETLTTLKAQEEEAERQRLEREAEEKRLMLEREKLAAERAEMEKQQKAEEEKLAAEREELRKQQEEMNQKLKESEERDRKLKEQEEAKAEAERKEQEAIEWAAEMERQRLLGERKAEQDRIAAEKAHAEEVARLEAATADHRTTLRSILATAQDETLTPGKKITIIVQLANLGIERGEA